MSEATVDPPAALTLLRRAEHVLFVALLLVGAGRCVTDRDHAVAAVIGALSLLGWYVLGLLLARRAAGHAAGLAWLLILTAGWCALIVLSANFVWLVFPLLLLYLQLTPLRFAVPAVVVLTAATITALGVHRGQLDVAALIGPVLGAGVATVITLVYQGLRRESESRARLVIELTAAQQRLAATERRAGTLVERDRLARELHDTVAQSLASIVLLLRSAGSSYTDAPEPARRQLDTALDAARSALDDTRRMVRALAPARAGRPATGQGPAADPGHQQPSRVAHLLRGRRRTRTVADFDRGGVAARRAGRRGQRDCACRSDQGRCDAHLSTGRGEPGHRRRRARFRPG